MKNDIRFMLAFLCNVYSYFYCSNLPSIKVSSVVGQKIIMKSGFTMEIL